MFSGTLSERDFSCGGAEKDLPPGFRKRYCCKCPQDQPGRTGGAGQQKQRFLLPETAECGRDHPGLIALIQEKLPPYVEAKPFDIQVLTPMRKGLLGVERLNQILQRYLNPPDPSKKEKEYGQGLFREGDKIMQVKNNYQLEWEIRGKYGIPVDKGVGVFNGDTGILKSINEFAETAEVEFEDGRWAEYSFKQMEELELAYAVTIHKSQGSEYPAVVMPLLSGPRMLLNRNLLYTAVTRARKCVTIVGSEETFREMIRNEKQQMRYSSLDIRLREVTE